VTGPSMLRTANGGDDRSRQVAAAADRLLGHVAVVGELGSADVPDAESVVGFLRHLAEADRPAAHDDGRLDPLALVAATVVQSLVRAGFEVTADRVDLDAAYWGLVPVLVSLGVDVEPSTAEQHPGLWLRCVRSAAATWREGM